MIEINNRDVGKIALSCDIGSSAGRSGNIV
jgi:hypothetical protein